MKRKLILLGWTCIIWTTSAHAEPTTQSQKVSPKFSPSKKEQKSEWPFAGQLLPIKGDPDADVLNERWRDVAKLLEVSQLWVRQWPSAFNFVGGPERIQKRTLEALRQHGYKVEQWEYKDLWGVGMRTPGFDAVCEQKRYTAMWLWNGSHLMLYWGVPKPAKQSK